MGATWLVATWTAGLTRDEKALYGLLNRERSDAGLIRLRVNPVLVELARFKASDMAESDYFSHRSPKLGTHLEMIRAAGLAYEVTGENLAKARNVGRAHVGFMASDGHRRNVLGPSFSEIGIGVVRYTHGVVVCQLFAGGRLVLRRWHFGNAGKADMTGGR
jgi:uncharacterized protein YkwD